VEGSRHAVKAGIQQRLLGAELGSESVCGVHGRDRPIPRYRVSQRGVFANQRHGPGPGVGNNQLTGTPFGYSAHTGYDIASGWGTPQVASFVASLTSK